MCCARRGEGAQCSCTCPRTHRQRSCLCACVLQLRGRVKPFAAMAEARTSLGQRLGSRSSASDPASYRRSSLQQAR